MPLRLSAGVPGAVEEGAKGAEGAEGASGEDGPLDPAPLLRHSPKKRDPSPAGVGGDGLPEEGLENGDLGVPGDGQADVLGVLPSISFLNRLSPCSSFGRTDDGSYISCTPRPPKKLLGKPSRPRVAGLSSAKILSLRPSTSVILCEFCDFSVTHGGVCPPYGRRALPSLPSISKRSFSMPVPISPFAKPCRMAGSAEFTPVLASRAARSRWVLRWRRNM